MSAQNSVCMSMSLQEQKHALVSDFQDCCATWNNIFVCFWAAEGVIVSLCDNWPPPPRSQLHRSLQCCSLLNYYQWVWRDTCSLFPLTISLMTSLYPLSHTHACTQTLGLYFIWHGFGGRYAGKKKTWRDLYCAGRRWGRCFHVKRSRLMGITLWHRHRSAYGHAWMHSWAGHIETQMLLCSFNK